MPNHHNPPAQRTILDEVFSALASSQDSSWRLQQASNGTIVLLTPRTGGRFLVRVEERPLAGFDPDTNTIICPRCGATSNDGQIEHWEDEVARRNLTKVSGNTVLFDTTIDRFDDDGTDARLGCTRCGNAADFPDNLTYDWSEPDSPLSRLAADETPHAYAANPDHRGAP